MNIKHAAEARVAHSQDVAGKRRRAEDRKFTVRQLFYT